MQFWSLPTGEAYLQYQGLMPACLCVYQIILDGGSTLAVHRACSLYQPDSELSTGCSANNTCAGRL